MFYCPDISNALRMGDIVSGFILGAARQQEPKVGSQDYHVNLRSPSFSVILTPCCSIGDKTLSLAPLVAINPKWMDNPYFSTDLTNINREMNPEQAVSPAVWQNLLENEKYRRLEEGCAFALVEWFVFPPHEKLGTYRVKRGGAEIEAGHYAIDFRLAHRVECDAVVNTKQVPITAKILELDVPARTELRNKLSGYFGRVPMEDAL
jgi:hypothetical protein